ncbi:MAG TPA: PKD domain-containing protein, partial [Pyrinomonadaceae bacterium]|nr:PKD domain-containing protein [Pyrinomonadaceae bacterium]
MSRTLTVVSVLCCTIISALIVTNQLAPKSAAQKSSLLSLVANAGPDVTVYAGEPLRLDGSNSLGYSRESLADGTWSTRWTTGDGYDVENLVKAPHVYMQPGTYTAQLTVRDSLGSISTDTAIVNVLPITSSTSQTLVDTGNPETNKTNLQSALNQAALNPAANEIIVPAGFVANDPIILPARERAFGTYVTVRVADLSALPANQRVSGGDRAKLFKIDARPAYVTGYNQALLIGLNSNYFRFVGMEITRSGALEDYKNDIIAVDMDNAATVETRPSHLIFDRVLLDARETTTVRAFAPNSEFTSLLNSSILKVRTNWTETKAIGQWSGNGPLAVVNNRLEAASINFLVGGADVTFSSEVLDGLVFRGNHS